MRSKPLIPFVPPVDPVDRAYLAGLFEGEGYVEQRKSRHSTLAIGMTDRSVVDWLAQFGGSIAYSPHTGRRNRGCYHWRLHNKPAICAFIDTIAPYMHGREKLAQMRKIQIAIRS